MIKIINYLFQSLLIYSFFILGRILGLKISRKLFSFLFILIGPIFKSKKIVEKNMIIFLKKSPLKNKNEIINNMWKNYGKTFIEYIFLNYFRKQKSHIFIKGEENLFQIKKQNKPVIFISGHFANFELMSMEITKKNIDLATIYRPLNNFFLNPLMEFIRRRYVCPNQIKKGINGVRDTVKFIKKKYSIALMIDQRVSEGEKIDFFGNLALTTTLPAQLSYKFGLDIIPVYIEREDNDNFTIEFQKRISSKDFKNKLELTLKLNKILEEMIKKNPGQWIWTHNRWK
ncbi:lysophospholipid acyltransferase family protein [Pelagibacteraceae bacterium]|jgi:KDO2-lipid IV(A) lauroyltransferase|nr:lysophospholipid acyltransferase family protein [Pelagibacteraceae bacterium]MDC0447511.1 lysophospholipid acyltransferase family protein [Pelagibacteraceae bacterium]